jgi:hypothetical protein
MEPLPGHSVGTSHPLAGSGHAVGPGAAVPGSPLLEYESTASEIDGGVTSAEVIADAWPTLSTAAVSLGLSAAMESTPHGTVAVQDIPDEFPFARQPARAWFGLGQVALPVRAGVAIVGAVLLTAAIIMAGADRHPTVPGPPPVRAAVLHASAHDMNRMWSNTP